MPRNDLTGSPKRSPLATILLALAFTGSLAQYFQTGEVTWITDSFRKIETTANQLTNGNLEDYQARVSNVFTRLSEDTDKLTTEGVANSLRASRDGISGSVVAVTDGDTIKVLDPSHVLHEVRLTGIDAPERDQPFSKASTKYLTSLLAGKDVFVEWSKSDRYGRVLGKVWVQPADCPKCGKTLDANHAQLLAGMAWWYRYYAQEQPPEDRGRYESAEDEARKRGWGLWADPHPVNPYDFRKGSR
ncbi:MAG: thermonuclease family protein [Halioglobus sp.]